MAGLRLFSRERVLKVGALSCKVSSSRSMVWDDAVALADNVGYSKSDVTAKIERPFILIGRS